MEVLFGSALMILAAIVSGTTLLALIAVLLLCRFIVRETRSTAGLRDLAIVLSAFGNGYARRAVPGPLPSRRTRRRRSVSRAVPARAPVLPYLPSRKASPTVTPHR